MTQEHSDNKGTKLCASYALLLRQAVRIGMENSGGRLTPEQVTAARTIAVKDQQFHKERVPFKPMELYDLSQQVTRETSTT
ncbi:hypothetical protein A3A76_03245 [Candidatus Woesebacteria bacterium RIFCSPLOWO2_01_FULL_39_23]|uniref:Uncharacterized protein n=1 Tax=Candidatus Woesebacteria bacterium RIFCSPHIGHO2_01_FULL_40_22 TaxID=1802499 RepID=A0A1F7YJN1_9BACT|nr:MAG: hypothetical protein A2141_00780 [Candidatus Woesebacteria bacterium RBG_16_40_11]OGM27477.1 MAG: hypothetical protein A2628_01645 [Candidatus Woesebacteria bacterium RIFCSPHIGHO2_01_FULL_40_22]OGM36566.1 MAG: hypothetical protein A3E41_04000 [Candidatus Woesebacteria bacterium RIFCSPHIGHO2_12_FULL_38_9]OGM62651.1 MAG: hypothetical protein A3A76_03245 [Candidatus Woesebacteria bacterium RIFCSPLOWO2_01_FULL_39_23]